MINITRKIYDEGMILASILKVNGYTRSSDLLKLMKCHPSFSRLSYIQNQKKIYGLRNRGFIFSEVKKGEKEAVLRSGSPKLEDYQIGVGGGRRVTDNPSAFALSKTQEALCRAW